MVSFAELGGQIVSGYQAFVNFLPFWMQDFINLFLISMVIVVYAILIWKFYRFMAKKDLIALNLKKYNRSKHPVLERTVAAGLYILEYLIILPFMVFFWFAAFTVFLILLTEGLEINTILVISATVIVAIRMTAYYKEDVSKEIAKLLPYTLLGVSITKFGAFSFDKILGQVFAIPNFLTHIMSYLFFIFIIEFILRLTETIFMATGVNPEGTQVKEVEEVPTIK